MNGRANKRVEQTNAPAGRPRVRSSRAALGWQTWWETIVEYFGLLRSRIEREIERDRCQLTGILKLPDDSVRAHRLRELAAMLGASTIKAYPGYGDADQPELVHNIHVALQTKAMAAAVRTSSNYVIVTVILAIIALASAVASWVAVLRFR